jgi:hypothetical protein
VRLGAQSVGDWVRTKSSQRDAQQWTEMSRSSKWLAAVSHMSQPPPPRSSSSNLDSSSSFSPSSSFSAAAAASASARAPASQLEHGVQHH